MGLKLSENETKYAKTRKRPNLSGYLEIGNFKFETMHNCIYLGSLVDDGN